VGSWYDVDNKRGEDGKYVSDAEGTECGYRNASEIIYRS
jgi:hypothetical protein